MKIVTVILADDDDEFMDLLGKQLTGLIDVDSVVSIASKKGKIKRYQSHYKRIIRERDFEPKMEARI